MAEIHNRMPVILHKEDFATWLDRDIQESAPLLPLLVPFDASKMGAEPI
jgi:putative SOS response-associated peptidase YedK